MITLPAVSVWDQISLQDARDNGRGESQARQIEYFPKATEVSQEGQEVVVLTLVGFSDLISSQVKLDVGSIFHLSCMVNQLLFFLAVSLLKEQRFVFYYAKDIMHAVTNR